MDLSGNLRSGRYSNREVRFRGGLDGGAPRGNGRSSRMASKGGAIDDGDCNGPRRASVPRSSLPRISPGEGPGLPEGRSIDSLTRLRKERRVRCRGSRLVPATDSLPPRSRLELDCRVSRWVLPAERNRDEAIADLPRLRMSGTTIRYQLRLRGYAVTFDTGCSPEAELRARTVTRLERRTSRIREERGWTVTLRAIPSDG